VGEIRLEVKDPSAAPMQVSGRLVNQTAGIDRSFVTDAQGLYAANNLPFGRYRVELSKSGFALETVLIDVQAEAAVARTVTMQLSRAAFDVDVISTTPLPGVELSRDEIPAAVQALTQTDIANSGALDLSDFLNRRLNGVNVNEVQGNPYQPDVNYRGYTASPLLGTPQGLSVYMDGVRLNQPFGDVVSWDLIPRVAISEAALMPGSNPLFGLNTLGGALSIQTKDGSTQPGTSLELSGGSFGRKIAELEHGGSNSKGLSWYLAGNLFFEDGWWRLPPRTCANSSARWAWRAPRPRWG
jgi:outer membrane cobalamin receptor